jgi:hypothetical protein
MLERLWIRGCFPVVRRTTVGATAPVMSVESTGVTEMILRLDAWRVVRSSVCVRV